jgi:DNA-binding GntR family transcriptional regulator
VDRPADNQGFTGSAIPGLTERLYRRLAESLKDDFKPGDRFPSEREIAQRFGVSRPTAAKAVSRLMDEGLLQNRRGLGRFVIKHPLDYNLSSLVSFTSRCIAEGIKPSTEVIEFKAPGEEQMPEAAVKELQLLPGEGGYYFLRRRFAGERPVILEQRWIAARFCPGLVKTDVTGSFCRLLNSRFKLYPIGVKQIIKAVIMERREQILLWEDSSNAAFEIRATGYLEGGVPLWYERTLYHGGAYELHNHLGPLSTAKPAITVLIN